MSLNYSEIIEKIDEHLSKSGKTYYNEFYIGITKDPENRLFKEHGVSKENSWWLYINAGSSELAREVEKHYLEEGMRGGDGGGNDDSTYVYCYTVTPTTIDK